MLTKSRQTTSPASRLLEGATASGSEGRSRKGPREVYLRRPSAARDLRSRLQNLEQALGILSLRIGDVLAALERSLREITDGLDLCGPVEDLIPPASWKAAFEKWEAMREAEREGEGS